jgi:arylsulfatase A-like enzyme/Flp pilus assembly protein TadD
MKVSAFSVLAASLTAAAAVGAPARNSATPPNVVVITIDTLRADHLGCYGYSKIRTPAIDALAADGVRFERAYTPVPITLPAHTVIFTGTYPPLNGMHDFSGNRLGPQPPTLASVLKERGYSTGAVVGSGVLDSRFGLNRGFDFYYDHFEFNRLEEANLDEMERAGNVVADQTLDWLSKNYSKRFFLWMHLYDPHYPYRPPPPYAEQYKSHPYDGEIAFADQQVGRLLHFLKEKGLYSDAIIVLAGDHGEGLGEHGEQTHGFFIYNSTLHVPLIFHLPGTGNGKRVASPASLADVMPTVLQLLKLPVPQQVQGKSLMAQLLPKKESEARSDRSRPLYSETFLPRLHFSWSELRGIESDKYHFIEAPQPELYDLRQDPAELENLYSRKPAVAAELRTTLHSLVRDLTAGEELAQKTGLDPALMERLKSLGYAGFSGGGDTTAKNADLADPKDRIQVYELISDGMAASQHGHYDESVQKLTKALETEPNSVPVHYLLGLDYYRMKDFSKAIAHFQRTVDVSPDYALAVYQLGLSYARAGDMTNAIQYLKRALELDNTNFSAAYNLGAAYLHEGNTSEAASAFRQALAISPDYAAAHIALGELLLFQGKVDDSLVELRRAVDLAPGDPHGHAALAKALQAKGQVSEAEQEMRKAQEGSARQP